MLLQHLRIGKCTSYRALESHLASSGSFGGSFSRGAANPSESEDEVLSLPGQPRSSAFGRTV